jgi:tetratricopeptide (TPR) repeat protein
MKLPEQAVQQFEQALEDRMNRPMALLGLARARVQLGQQEDAIEPLEKLLKIWSLAEADFAPLQSAKQLLHEARRPVAEAAQQDPD